MPSGICVEDGETARRRNRARHNAAVANQDGTNVPHSLDQKYPDRLLGRHFPDFVNRKDDRRACELCDLFTGRKHKSWVFCSSCGIHLCVGGGGRNDNRKCFKAFHECIDLKLLASMY